MSIVISPSLEELRAKLEYELSRLSTRIERGRGPRGLTLVTVTLSSNGTYKGPKKGESLPGYDAIIFDGFIGSKNSKDDLYTGMTFEQFVFDDFRQKDGGWTKAGITDLLKIIQDL